MSALTYPAFLCLAMSMFLVLTVDVAAGSCPADDTPIVRMAGSFLAVAAALFLMSRIGT